MNTPNKTQHERQRLELAERGRTASPQHRPVTRLPVGKRPLRAVPDPDAEPCLNCWAELTIGTTRWCCDECGAVGDWYEGALADGRVVRVRNVIEQGRDCA